MVIVASTLTDVLIAAPLGFMFGLLVGIFVANKYVVMVIKEKYRVVDKRNYPDKGA